MRNDGVVLRVYSAVSFDHCVGLWHENEIKADGQSEEDMTGWRKHVALVMFGKCLNDLLN